MEIPKPKLEKRKIVYTCGVYDLFHLGHLKILQRAYKCGDELCVGIVKDSAVKAIKGLNRPIINEKERFLLVNNLLWVNDCMFQETFDPSLNLEILHNRHYEDEIIFVKGEDQDHISEIYAKENNIKIVKLPRTQGVSTSEIIKRIKSEC